ncbi:MAG: hypothetical protein IPH50_11610 [Rhodanobacteraceae bacterium]|nr:hypothetical protein [Rhodanobacteraceae bacterium]
MQQHDHVSVRTAALEVAPVLAIDIDVLHADAGHPFSARQFDIEHFSGRDKQRHAERDRCRGADRHQHQ